MNPRRWLAAAPFALYCLCAAPTPAATLAHRYSFDAGATDSVGGIDGTLVGGATVSAGRLNLGGGSGPGAASMGFASSIDLAGRFGAQGVTIETWYTDTGSGNWSKLFSFGNGTAGQNIIFNLQQGGSGEGRVQYNGMAPEANFGPRPALNTEHHLALTISPSGEVNAWIDGAPIDVQPPNQTGDGSDLSALPSSWERIGASAWGDAGMQGSVEEFRIWEGEMTGPEVGQSLAAGPDSLPGGGPLITTFTASPADRREGQSATLAWDIDVSDLDGALALELRGPGGAVLHSSGVGAGSFPITIGDTGGTAAVWTYTLDAWDTDRPAEVRSATAEIAVDPGIPVADGQSLQTVATAPLAITLGGTDPNAHPNATLSYSVTGDPAGGVLSGTAPTLTYAADPGFAGSDAFTFTVDDGKYTSAEATVTIEVLAAPAAPTDIGLSSTSIREDVLVGGLVAALSSTDANPGDMHTYSLVAGGGDADNGLFAIVGNQLRAAASFAGQVGSTYSVRLRTLDSSGLSFEKAFSLDVVAPPTAVVINEIHYNPPENPVRQEFIELFNPAGAAVDLSGWRLSGAVDYLFPDGAEIAAGGYLVVAEDPPTLSATLGAAALGPFAGALNSDGETVRLRDAADGVIDEVDYKVGFPWPVAADGGGASIELISPDLDNSLGSSWRPSIPGVNLPEATLLPFGSGGWSWRPGDSEASAPVDAWRGAGFPEDGSWTADVALPIGYGTVNGVPLATSISGMRNSYTCLFLRGSFTVAPGEMPSQLLLNSTSDDGVVIWINGVEVARHRFAGEPAVGLFGSNQGDEGSTDTATVLNPGTFLVEGENTVAVQLFNATLGSSDLGFDLEILRPGSEGAAPTPTPGAVNAASAPNAAPNIRKVEHSPEAPTSADPVLITAKVTDPQGVASVSLEYQLVAPGAYVPAKLPLPIVSNNIDVSQPRPDNPGYEAGWVAVPMRDDGTGGDALAGDDFYSAALPAAAHRSLVRYRITVEDGLGLAARAPYADDPSLNFAYFVYDGVPDYNGHPAATLNTLPVYHLITRGEDYAECYAYDGSDQINQGTEARFLYNWNGTIVYDGVVYDNITYRLRGANGRYHGRGKRSMRFRFHDGYYFQARDQAGEKRSQKWRTLTTGKGFDNRSTLTFGLNEAVSMHLFNKAGVPGPDTQWIHWRVIDDQAEAPDRWRGDFQGLYFVLETYDVRFLEAHGLAKGNLYKLINQTTDWLRQRRYQAAFAPADGSDHNSIEAQLDGGDSADDISARVNLDRWNRSHAIVEAVRHYDYWPSANKNMVYYFEPDYTPENDFNGKLWILPWDTDASWGPTWNGGHDVVYNALFASGYGGGDGNSTPELWPAYFNDVREVRDLLWQPDQIEPLIDEFAAVIAPFEAADADRWKGAPANAGNYGGLGGAGASSLANLAQDMKNFAFVGGSWPGGGVGAGGRAAHLDALQASQGEGARIPATPTIAYAGTAGFPTNGLAFQSSAFSDPQGAGTFGAMEWRIAEVTDPTAPAHDPTERFKLEIDADWESGELADFAPTVQIPTTAVRSGHSYRARVRHRDDTGRWSHWSAPVEFTATLPDISGYLAGLVVSEVMYHPADPSAAELAAGFDDDDFFEFIELKNVGDTTLDLTDLRFTKGVDFDFLGAAVTALAPGEFALVVNNAEAFELRYGAGLPVAGEWEATDKLDNGGEQLKLSFGAGDPVRDFVYDDRAPWPIAPDGAGPSLSLADPDSVPDHALASSWVASSSTGGSPGADDAGQTYAQWRDAVFGPGEPPGSGELEDPDLDGLTNLAEFALAGDPLNAASRPRPRASVQVIGGESLLVLEYPRRSGLAGVVCEVELSLDLQVWFGPGDGDFVVEAQVQDNGDGTETVTTYSTAPLAAQPRQFLRVRVAK